ncbi:MULTISPECIES: DUF5994 family protein [unclassified Streptomyces]|uniref:DUF5994 family protein n=1 Tax=unclassified Streptomyces TaxID=2593676 RepID=UPI0006B03202|nr:MULTISPECIES: DUF5994 family protein [unclassified Streptomyces]KOX37850.1 hypothetical protein ADL06_02225 [Streptomyces sp. NRRL F-6491]KOX40788.1 hypothetical protein ADL08_21535 [Streptomyces sp. NRRL F-6492]
MTTVAPPLPARLTLTPGTTPIGLLDGAWWPRSRDLAAELPSLVGALESRFGRITRVTVNPTRWPVVPHKVPATGHTVHVGWFTEQDPDKMILLSYAVGRCDLLVVPPGTEPDAAARLMDAAAAPGGALTAGALMSGEVTAGRGARDARGREDSWETDGGAASPPLRHPAAGARMISLPGTVRR